MQNLSQLMDKDPAWPLVRQWCDAAGDRAVVLPCVPDDGERTLLALQVSTHSTLGSLALHAGGILVDHGWLRILGAGHPRILGNLRDWNHIGGETVPGVPRVPGAFVVAHDALGGVFAVNAGGLQGPAGHVFYLTPDAAEWEDTDLGHTAFIHWCLGDQVDAFYGADRWNGFEEEVSALLPHQAFMFDPPLWGQFQGWHAQAQCGADAGCADGTVGRDARATGTGAPGAVKTIWERPLRTAFAAPPPR